MATDICIRRLNKELSAYQKDPITSPKISIAPNESNILEMHYVIEGSTGTPYQGGVYHGKLVFPKQYPLKPPSVLLLTPSGRFQPNRRLCLSMSDFHPESWNPMWSIATILTGLYSFMLESSPTLGSIESTVEQKQAMAQSSLRFNCQDATFRKLFPDYVHRYEAECRQTASEPVVVRSSSLLDRPNVQGLIPVVLAVFAAIVSLVWGYLGRQ